ncbi:hypothetical protein [Hyphomicrobium sp.]|uniref:hypothetical protein n=1 Tax=Hyphomicrobium sp. TaxID=82 RepID=UPI000FB150D1|nr:hypothetical protein [Hyphomicrobium sp.]RUP08803.1 MAG: hypothetical protein EKK38_13770 [Hyphomicrobium sp.]
MVRQFPPLVERISRALCQANGNPTDTRVKGKPMWQTYRRDAQAAIDGSGIDELVHTVRSLIEEKRVSPAVRAELVEALMRFEGESESIAAVHEHQYSDFMRW